MSTTTEIAHPPIVTPDEWLAERKKLLAHEKELTRNKDRISAARRRLPMVRLDKAYEFDGSEGKRSLKDLFEGQRQLIVYHFMFDPDWDKGCSGCTAYVDAIGPGTQELLKDRDTRFVLISRAPLPKLEKYKSEKGWPWPWYSSFGSDFNYDFHATVDEKVAPVEYNYLSKAEIEEKGLTYITEGEQHGMSVFFRMGDELFHTYSSYARGVEGVTDAYALLDTTPYGRQEDFEDSPAGWPQRPTYAD